MSSTLDSDVLITEYEDEIRSWDWKMIIKWFDNHGDSPDYYEDDGDGNRFVHQWLGTVFGLTPSGKVYTFWTTNQTEEDVIRDGGLVGSTRGRCRQTWLFHRLSRWL